jgi:hypothetical protein
MKPWPPSGFSLDAMVILCSRAFKLGDYTNIKVDYPLSH